MKKYYEFFNNSSFESQWAIASQIIPTSRTIQWSCPECGRVHHRPSGCFEMVLDGGTQFPDVLACGVYPLLIVSDRVVTAWENSGIKSYLQHPLSIAAIQNSELEINLAPVYYSIEIVGKCSIDLVASRISIRNICNRCGEIDRKPTTIRPLKLFEGSWDGSDLFCDQRLFPQVNFCTEKILKLFLSHNLTNASFKNMI